MHRLDQYLSNLLQAPKIISYKTQPFLCGFTLYALKRIASCINVMHKHQWCIHYILIVVGTNYIIVPVSSNALFHELYKLLTKK